MESTQSPKKGTMAPKAKVKAKAKARAMAKVRAKGKAKAKAVPARRLVRLGAAAKAAGRGRMRRPAVAGDPALTHEDIVRLWESGHSLALREVPLDLLLSGKPVIIEEAVYFHKQGKVACTVTGSKLKRDSR